MELGYEGRSSGSNLVIAARCSAVKILLNGSMPNDAGVACTLTSEPGATTELGRRATTLMQSSG